MNLMLRNSTAAVFLLALCSMFGRCAGQEVTPFPRPVYERDTVTISFDKGAAGFQATHDCQLRVEDAHLVVVSSGEDPYLVRPTQSPYPQHRVIVSMRTNTSDHAAVYWTAANSPSWGEEKVRVFPIFGDGQWHDYAVEIETPGGLTGLRIDPGTAPGVYEIASIRLIGLESCPVFIDNIEVTSDRVAFSLRNESERPIEVRYDGASLRIDASGTQKIIKELRKNRVLEPVALEYSVADFKATVRREVWVYNDDVPAQWLLWSSQGETPYRVEIAPQDNVLRIREENKTLAALAPIVAIGSPQGPGFLASIPPLQVRSTERGWDLQGDGVEGTVTWDKGVLSVNIRSTREGTPIEGPVVRAFGDLEQGLFAGLEYLDRGEKSSSTLDIETEEHLRYAPDRLKVTMPLMAFVTGSTAVALTWRDMTLQPIYATPNAFDGTAEHRMSLRGQAIEGRLKVASGTIEDAILWATREVGLPALPKPPRSEQDQFDLCLWSLTEGPLHNEDGWGHCVEPNWRRDFHVDMVSTIWCLSGKLWQMPHLVPGGAHLPNETAWLLTGRGEQWLRILQHQRDQTLAQQQSDGSFRYRGPYQKGHYEDTSSGYCARPAMQLLEYAYFTGDKEALAAGIKALEYMKRFKSPRGAQTWELSLHTPDILASGWLVWAYVRGYELTGRTDFLVEARRWALSGVPFVYLWGEYPVMAYATIPVYGATNWRAPNWMGLPVQWCGLVYAYSLTLLAPHDDTLPWQQLAEGILIAGEQMQVPREEGEKAGLLPDSFHLRAQRRQGPFINPCALVSLRLALSGRPHRPLVASDENHRVVSPFAVAIKGGKAVVQAQQGVNYQVIIDGKRLVAIERSAGEDQIPLD